MSETNEPLTDGDDDRRPGELMTSAGAQLAAFREQRGWTVEQVASQLNLAPRQIIALESDNYPALPGMPIVRGFIRAYAKLLKVDPAPLLAVIGDETMAANEPLTTGNTLAAPFSESRLPTMTDKPGMSSKWVIGLLLVILLCAALWAAQQSSGFAAFSRSASSQVKAGLSLLQGPESKAQAVKREMPKAVNPGESSAPAPASPAAGAQKPTVAAPPASNGNASATSSPASTASAEPAALNSATTAQPATAASTAAVPTPADNALVLSAHQDSWVEVRRVRDNSILISRVLKPGETERIDVDEPVSLVVGNASGLDASLRGKTLEIKGSSRTGVARLTLK